MRILFEMGPEYADAVRTLGDMGTAVLAATDRGLQKGGQIAAGVVVRDYLSGQSLKRRSGALAREVTSWSEAPLDTVVGVPENSPAQLYAWLLSDEEKTIRPKKAKALTIPIGENLTPTGSARYPTARAAESSGKELFTIKSKVGNLLLGYRRGTTGRGRFRPLFVLVKSVFIQGTGALYDGVMASVDDINDQIQSEINQVEGVND